ncbi:MAG: xanthine dehydrogenase family protein molybdopterin-binding subunit [Pseudomonadota bacterium]
MKKFGVSQSVRRVEDPRLLKGEGRYIADLPWPNHAHGVFARSTIAHGRLVSLDIDAAKAAPGVIGVITGADLDAAGANDVGSARMPNRDGSMSPRPQRPALASGRVRYAGEALALVVAETLAQAQDAAELIEADIDPDDAVVDMRAALAPGAPQLHEDAPANLCLDWEIGDEAAADAAMAAAAHKVELSLVNNRVISNPMETRGVIAEWDAAAGALHVETNAQGVWNIKREIAKRLALEPENVRVTTQDVGGGFGTKSFAYPEQIAVAFAARALGRPVRWIASRSEGFLTDAQGRDHLTTATAGFNADQKLVALKVETLAGLGAYLSPFAPFIPTGAASRVLPGVYDVQALYCGVKGIFTNTAPVDAYRGAGRPESIYMIERLMDKAARAFGADPVALRRKSFIPVEAMPYETAVGETYDTGDFNRVMSAALRQADWNGFEARRAAAAARGKLRGAGLCYYIESILGDQNETAHVALAEDGGVDLYVGTQSNGQGHETAYAQILHQRTGLPFEAIRIIQGDSDRIPTGGGTGGSRSVTMQGAAINAASDALIEQLKPLAEEELEVGAADLQFDIELEGGGFRVAGTDRTVTLQSLGARARASGRAALAETRLENVVPGRSFPNGCHIAEVEIDPATGEVSVERYAMTDDFGVLINPMLAEGQAHGGVAQGIGQAILEHVVYDEGGQLLSGSFMDYAMPRAADTPDMAFATEPTPSTANPIGMKGCGEAGTVGALAAVTNAALDALWPLGVRDIDMPLTPLKVWETIQAAKPAAAAE